jgi:hypothetical protein
VREHGLIHINARFTSHAHDLLATPG